MREIELGAVDAVNGITYIGRLKIGLFRWKMRNYIFIPTAEISERLRASEGYTHYTSIVRKFYEENQSHLEKREDLGGRLSNLVTIHDLDLFSKPLTSLDNAGERF